MVVHPDRFIRGTNIRVTYIDDFFRGPQVMLCEVCKEHLDYAGYCTGWAHEDYTNYVEDHERILNNKRKLSYF